MEMAPYSYGGNGADAEWYQALGDFHPFCSSPLPLAAVPPGADHLSGELEGSSHLALPAADFSSSSLINLREDENYYLPPFAAPPAAEDLYCTGQLPPMPADVTTAGLDDAPLLPLGDLDLEAFGGDADEQKPPVDHMMIVPADRHVLGQNAGVDGVHGHHMSTPAVDCYNSNPVGSGLDMALVRHHVEQQHRASSVAALPPSLPPPSSGSSGGSDRSLAPAGKTRLDHIGFDELRRYFYMPITKAAREMNVGLTVLKKRCRELGVARWPHRKMKSLKSLILNVQKMGKEGMSPAAVQRELAALETYCELMEENPSIELTDRTKKLRQACFKESYKRRRAAAGNVIDHIYSFGHGHPLRLQAPSSSAAQHSQITNNDFFAY
ncbi:hypothetical protein ACP70R_046668 [Stipagrostis hirtigluma subsp. patula]